jgi:hypothetical protein
VIEYYANVAEIVGVILVVVTLVFLTLEIRHNTRALRATTIQSVMQSEMALSNFLAEHAETWEKVLTGAQIEAGAEMRKAIIIFNVFMIDTENRYHQFLAGFLDAQSWESRKSTLPEMVQLPVFPAWRESPGGRSHAADFLALVDSETVSAREE